MKRVLLSTFGSAGDLFPYVPLALQLREQGHEVTFAVPRSLALFLRPLRFTCIPLGDGTEMRVMGDPRIASLRFDGWDSWRTTLEAYVAHTLPADIDRVAGFVASAGPDLILAGSFAVAARTVGILSDVPTKDACIYPQQSIGPYHGRRFARGVRSIVAKALGVDAMHELVGAALWGSAGATLYDPVLLGAGWAGERRVIGYPYWDQAYDGPHSAKVLDWIERTEDGRPLVLVTLGSFLGVNQKHVIEDVRRCIGALGIRGLVLGPTGQWANDGTIGSDAIHSAGAIPVSAVADRANAVLHHGGVGTTMAVLRSGVPAIIVARSFDQQFNGRRIESLGVGRLYRGEGLIHAIDSILRDRPSGESAARLVGRLTSCDLALSRLREVVEL